MVLLFKTSSIDTANELLAKAYDADRNGGYVGDDSQGGYYAFAGSVITATKKRDDDGNLLGVEVQSNYYNESCLRDIFEN